MPQFTLMFQPERSVIRKEILTRHRKLCNLLVINNNGDVDKTLYNKYNYNVKKSCERQ